MSAALMAQPSLYRTAMAISTKAKRKGKNRKRKKNTMAGGACATAFSLEVCEDITGGAVGARGLGPVVGMGFTAGTGSGESSSAGDEGGMGWGFINQWG